MQRQPQTQQKTSRRGRRVGTSPRSQQTTPTLALGLWTGLSGQVSGPSDETCIQDQPGPSLQPQSARSAPHPVGSEITDAKGQVGLRVVQVGLQQHFALRDYCEVRPRSRGVEPSTRIGVAWVHNCGFQFRPKTDQGSNKEQQAASMTALNLLGRRLGLQASPSLPSCLIGF